MSSFRSAGLWGQRPPTLRGVQALEPRLAMSATPPTVVEISVASDDWTSDFTEYLQTSGLGSGNQLVDGSEVLTPGYTIPTGSSAQNEPLPWNNINQIRIRFSEDVDVDAADLSLTGVNQPTYAFSDFSYFPEVRLGVWTVAAPLGNDSFLIDLDADGLDPVQDRNGNILDGDWTNGVTSGASGDGVAGGDFEFSFQVLPADATGDAVVSYPDVFSINRVVGQDTTDSRYKAASDIDGDGLISSSDLQAAFGGLGEATPSGTPLGVVNDAPTTTGLGYVEIDDEAIDVAISLFDAFDDAETPDQQLVYSIESVSDPLSFDTISIDSQTGELIVNAASGVSGRETVVASATDQSGQAVQSTLVVDIDHQNTAPTLSVTASHSGYGVWVVEGTVTDPDTTNFDDYVVFLGGILDQFVSVAESGYFYYPALLLPGEAGSVWATTGDGQDTSNIVYLEIGY